MQSIQILGNLSMGEFNVYGIYVPTLLVQGLVAYCLLWFITRYTDRWMEQGSDAFLGLFNFCLYLVLLLLVHWLFIWSAF